MKAVALLRAVNVGGTSRLATTQLLAAAASLGYTEARTIGGSGSLMIRAAREESPDELARRLEAALALARPGLATTVLARSREEWTELVATNPLAFPPGSDFTSYLVMLLADEPSPGAVAALPAAFDGGERIAVVGRTAFLHYPGGVSVSRLTTGVLERRLGTRGTTRNWNVVGRIAAALAEA